MNNKTASLIVASILCLLFACMTPALIEFANATAPIEYKEMRGDKMIIKAGYELSINCLGCLLVAVGLVCGTNVLFVNLKSENPTGKNNVHTEA